MVTFTANIYIPLDRGMVLIQLRCKFSHKDFQKRMQSSKIFEEFEVRGQGRGQGLGNRGQ